MNTRTLTVTGKGHVETAPNQVILSFSLSAEGYAYQTTVEALNLKVENLRLAAESFGVGRDQLKTTNFSIMPKYQYHERTREREFRGFTASHDLRLEIPFDKETLNHALKAIAKSGSDAQFNIRFAVAETEALKMRTLQAAVADATTKANIIADAASVRLGSIARIDYGKLEVHFAEPDFDVSPMACMDPSTPEADIEPEDVGSSVSITLVWEISDAA
ncbi:MAG: SIMPL domain-containing protein [Candidatus Methylumidiphilus sp.]